MWKAMTTPWDTSSPYIVVAWCPLLRISIRMKHTHLNFDVVHVQLDAGMSPFPKLNLLVISICLVKRFKFIFGFWYKTHLPSTALSKHSHHASDLIRFDPGSGRHQPFHQLMFLHILFRSTGWWVGCTCEVSCGRTSFEFSLSFYIQGITLMYIYTKYLFCDKICLQLSWWTDQSLVHAS